MNALQRKTPATRTNFRYARDAMAHSRRDFAAVCLVAVAAALASVCLPSRASGQTNLAATSAPPTVTAGKQEASVPTDADVEAKLRLIVVPTLQFRETRVCDAIDFLRNASREFDKDRDPARRGVNILLNVTPEEERHVITFAATDISLQRAVKVIAEVAELDFWIEDGIVKIASKGTLQRKLVFRAYVVEQWAIRDMKRDGPQKYFEQIGIEFPKGSSINYNWQNGRLTVVNTLDNIAALEQILKGFRAVRK